MSSGDSDYICPQGRDTHREGGMETESQRTAGFQPAQSGLRCKNGGEENLSCLKEQHVEKLKQVRKHCFTQEVCVSVYSIQGAVPRS